MIKCASLFTCELDSPEVALEEIKSQLSEKIELKANTVGIIMCHTEFIEADILIHVAEGLPFEVIGLTTVGQAVNDIVDEMVLTVFVMTSDDVQFATGSVIMGDIATAAEALKNAAIEATPAGEIPGLILTFPPMTQDCPGDFYTATWSHIFPGVPAAGCMPATDNPGAAGSKVYYKGEISERLHAFVLCFGAVNPRFIIATLPDKDKHPRTGTVTRSQGPLVHEIDGQDAIDYMQKIGIIDETGESLGAGYAVPFMINHKDYDGVPVLRGLVSILNEPRAAVFAGSIDEGSSFTMLNMKPDDTLLTTEKELQKVADMNDVNGILAFSCAMRYVVLLSTDPTTEMASIQKLLSDVPFMASYVGGELCPTSEHGGAYTNRFHNYSLVAVVL